MSTKVGGRTNGSKSQKPRNRTGEESGSSTETEDNIDQAKQPKTNKRKKRKRSTSDATVNSGLSSGCEEEFDSAIEDCDDADSTGNVEPV